MAERVIVMGVRHISESFNERGGEQARDGATVEGAQRVSRELTSMSFQLSLFER